MSDLLDVVPIRKDANGPFDSREAQLLIGGDRRKSCLARIHQVATGSMKIIVPRFISPSQIVEILYRGCRVEARVVGCTELPRDTYLATVHLLRSAGVEMRSEPRLPVHLDAVLLAFGNSERIPVHVKNISQSGLGVAVPITLAVGQQVVVDIREGIALAEVRYCRVTPEGKMAGLQLLEFLDRDHPTKPNVGGSEDGARPGLSRVISMIRSKHNGFIAAPPDNIDSEEPA